MADYYCTFASWDYVNSVRKTDGTPALRGLGINEGVSDGGYVKNILGTAGYNDAVTVTFAQVNTDDTNRTISGPKWTALAGKISDERVRRGKSTYSLTLSNTINTDDVSSLITNLNIAGPASNYYYTGVGIGETHDTADTDTPPLVGTMAQATAQAPAPSLPSVPAKGSIVGSTVINDIINAVIAAAAVCTCNCNYCTCNCNYACTCNCNYTSDRRLKENIEFVKVESGLNVYTWNYIKDKTTRYMGVMAQELFGTKYENAVTVDNLGFYSVNYSKLPVIFKEV